MNLFEYRVLCADRAYVQKMLDDLPANCLIDRMSMEGRIASLDAKIAEVPSTSAPWLVDGRVYTVAMPIQPLTTLDNACKHYSAAFTAGEVDLGVVMIALINLRGKLLDSWSARAARNSARVFLHVALPENTVTSFEHTTGLALSAIRAPLRAYESLVSQDIALITQALDTVVAGLVDVQMKRGVTAQEVIDHAAAVLGAIPDAFGALCHKSAGGEFRPNRGVSAHALVTAWVGDVVAPAAKIPDSETDALALADLVGLTPPDPNDSQLTPPTADPRPRLYRG